MQYTRPGAPRPEEDSHARSRHDASAERDGVSVSCAAGLAKRHGASLTEVRKDLK